MKARWKVIVVLAAASVLSAFFLMRSDGSEQKALEETRRALRQQGFKTDLAEFDFSASEELRARAAALTNLGYTVRPAGPTDYLNLLPLVGPDSALVVWKQDKFQGYSGEDFWPTLRETLNASRARLDTACESALSGPIRFNLDASAGNGMLLPHLAALKRLAQTLAARVVLELRDGNKDGAWTNLLALTRLVTAWEPEPADVSHLVRHACATIAFNATWQALQAEGWPDERLVHLQHEWESVDFFKDLPETAAFKRASMVATCQLERQQPIGRLSAALNSAIPSPRSVWYALSEYWRQQHYRQHGTYEDEKALLLHYRDREQEMRRAVKSLTWSEMRQLPGVTNFILFQSKYPSSMLTMMNTRQIMLASQLYAQGLSQSFLGRAADAEARRRLIVTAIGLKRYHARHGAYPNSLQELVPELLKNPPHDFMDGKPLRYSRTDDGHFILYSVGLDCVDNGGEAPPRARGGSRYGLAGRFGPSQGTDLSWPRPASTADVETFYQEQLKAQAEQTDRDEDLQAEEQWRHTARRQAGVEKLLAAKPKARTAEPTFRSRPLSQALRNETAATTNKITLDELLTLRQVATGEEPETVTFEAPVNYDALTNLGSLQLYIDPIEDEDSDEGCAVGQLECRRATNGDCLLVWRTIYESPGKHALQMGLDLNEPARADEIFVGPVTPFVVSNLCQFSLSSAYFNPELGATLRAKLPELNGTYAMDITSPAGDRLKTISGTTSNGVIKVHWDLTDERGRKCTNNEFGSVFRITLPDSGRSQTLQGP